MLLMSYMHVMVLMYRMLCNEAGLDNNMQTPLFELSLVSEADVLKEIYSLKNKKSVGLDGIQFLHIENLCKQKSLEL